MYVTFPSISDYEVHFLIVLSLRRTYFVRSTPHAYNSIGEILSKNKAEQKKKHLLTVYMYVQGVRSRVLILWRNRTQPLYKVL